MSMRTPPRRRPLLRAGLAVLLTVTAGSLGAEVSSASSVYYVDAPVLSVDPIVREQLMERPVEHCTEYQPPRHHYRERRHRDDRRFVPSLVGGILGGLVGNQFGGGSGRKILTVVGAVAGSSIANDIAADRRARRTYAYPERRCHTTYERERVETVDGYHVVYEYAGQTFSKRVAAHPGEHVRVRVEAELEGP
jgi:uncharacterized protein YcfJ